MNQTTYDMGIEHTKWHAKRAAACFELARFSSLFLSFFCVFFFFMVTVTPSFVVFWVIVIVDWVLHHSVCSLIYRLTSVFGPLEQRMEEIIEVNLSDHATPQKRPSHTRSLQEHADLATDESWQIDATEQFLPLRRDDEELKTGRRRNDVQKFYLKQVEEEERKDCFVF
jgi:hypothetical protein